MPKKSDVLIVGAGAAGIGLGATLRHFHIENFTIIERYEIGASFRRWPKEMRFISPSFPSNGFGLLDLNAVTLGTSPAFSLQNEHPTGSEYAQYLERVAQHFELPIQTGIEVEDVEVLPNDEGFIVATSEGDFQTRFLIWAAGEFQYPNLNPFPGGEHCLHNSQITSWKDLDGDSFFVVGGYESGIDAAVNLAQVGKRVRLLDASGAWKEDSPDPSLSLSPYTLTRLRDIMPTFRVNLVHAAVEKVEKQEDGFIIHDSDGQAWTSQTPPILATGFKGSTSHLPYLFDAHEDGSPRLTEHDESIVAPGLFLVGPTIRHQGIIFCFIYKFRQRFAIVAHEIANRLGLDVQTSVEAYRANGMYLDDLSCCDDSCAC
ncbi:MAG: NAD(P)/FAD-dependent oxidoreductase [Chloroflexota bacterium]